MSGIEALAEHARTAHLTAQPPPTLEQAAGDFESLLLGTLLRSGTKPIGGKSLLDGGSAGRMYREMFYQELAREATVQGGFGIGRLLDTQPGSPTSEDERGE